MFYGLFIICLLVILLLRLYITFKQSMYELTNYQKILFITFYGFGSILFIFSTTCNFIVPSVEYQRYGFIIWWISLIFGIIGFFMYIIMAIYGMILFSNNLIKLMRLRKSMNDEVSSNIKPENVDSKLLSSVSRYVSLFTLAILTTITTFLLYAVLNIAGLLNIDVIYGVYICIFSIDILVNISCLHLQFAFAAIHYEKYCKCLAKHCYLFMMKRTL